MKQEFPLATDFHVEDFDLKCPYLPGKQATFRYWLPGRPVSSEESANRMAAGQRRHGQLVYRTNCRHCNQCVSLRVPVELFRYSKSQKRVWNRCRSRFTRTIGSPIIDSSRLRLLNKHHNWRGWLEGNEIRAEEYRNSFLTETIDSVEICYYDDNNLIGVAICDVGREALSAVYTYYDPKYQKESLGTFSILNQIEVCKDRKYEFLYLGFFVLECSSLNYKANFRPNQLLKNGSWLDFKT